MSKKGRMLLLIMFVGSAVLTVVLVLGIVFFIAGGEVDEETLKNALKQEVIPLRPKPSHEELTSIFLFDDKRVFNLSKQPSSDITMLQIDNVEMICFNEVPGIKNPLEIVNLYKNQFREMVSIYFQGLSPSSIVQPEGRESIKLELVQKMNDLIQSNEVTKNDLIYNIVIENWVYV